MARIQKLIGKVPVVTTMIALATLIVYCCPALSEQVFYDRLAVQQGQVWRILTAPLAHFSTSHLAWNLLAFLIFGAMLETFRQRSLILISGLTALVTGAVYGVFIPDLLYYGGLSGVLTGVVAYLGFAKIRRHESSQNMWAVVLVFLLAKILVESVIDQPLFVSPDGADFHVLPSSHLIGFGAAFFLCYCERNMGFMQTCLDEHF